MTRYNWNLDEPGNRVMLTGNEAVARGALESGVRVVSSYPGSPSVQVLECLAAVAEERNIYAEWSVNEKVALEVAAAGSFAGLRSLSVMKADGMNVAMDFLTTLPLSGIGAGLVVVVSDDPCAHSSIKEEDSRYLAPPAHIPLLEPSSPGEAREAIGWAFEVSEKAGLPVIVRLVTRICHARATVELGTVTRSAVVPDLPIDRKFLTGGRFHLASHQRLDSVRELFETSPFNRYEGPEKPELVLFVSGVSYFYALEALEQLNARDRVGILKVGTVWPLPERLIVDTLKRSSTVLFLEEIEPFLEEQVKITAAGHAREIGDTTFLGRLSGEVPWVVRPRGIGEMDPDTVASVLSKVLDIPFTPGSPVLKGKVEELPKVDLPLRLPSLCAGCPHRASYWAIKSALALDGRQGVVLGDIGCYALGALPTGYDALYTVHSMGSGFGIASGLGKLSAMGLKKPVIAVIGDSTFYHAGIQPLINAKTNDSRFLCVILDNDTTAMTGHQPHPGNPITAMGGAAPCLAIAGLIESLGIPVTVGNPFQVKETTETIVTLLKDRKLHALVLRGECALKSGRKRSAPKVYVDQDRCLGAECGCDMLCSRVFSCPANVWDEDAGKARIDEVLCTGCGVCVQLCPQGAIVAESE